MRRTPDHAARLGHSTAERPDDLRRVHLRPAGRIRPAGGARSTPGFPPRSSGRRVGRCGSGVESRPRAIASYSAERDSAVIISTSGRLSSFTGTSDLMAAPTRAKCDRRTSSRPDRRSFWPSDPRSSRIEAAAAVRSAPSPRPCARMCEPFNHSAGERTNRITHEIEARGVVVKKKKAQEHAATVASTTPSCASAKRSKKVRILSARVRDLFSRTPSGPS